MKYKPSSVAIKRAVEHEKDEPPFPQCILFIYLFVQTNGEDSGQSALLACFESSLFAYSIRTECQIKTGKRDNLGIFFLFLL